MTEHVHSSKYVLHSHYLLKLEPCSPERCIERKSKSIALALTYCASGSFGPFALPCVTKRSSYLLTLQLGGPQDLCLLGGRRVPYVYKKDRFQQNLQVISRKGESKSLPYARTNGEPYGLLNAMF